MLARSRNCILGCKGCIFPSPFHQNPMFRLNAALRPVRFAAATPFRTLAVFERTKPHLNIGTIGHVDHGKTVINFRENLTFVTIFDLSDFDGCDHKSSGRERKCTV
jgi:hypothetical protein